MAGVDVGEMLVSAVVSEVLDKLGSPVWMKIGSIWNLNDDLREMKKNLEMIEAVLSDAERKSITDKSICFWLKELKSAAYDIEDMMCEFETEIPANNQSDGWGASLRKALSATRMWKKRFDLAKQTKDMKEKLSEIAERRSQFGLSTKTGFDTEVVIKERETFSDINIDDPILGRDKEKEELMRMLMHSDGREDISIIVVVGLGGIGKTTLVQLLYNDKNVKAVFDQQAWAYVSMEFDLKNIGKALLESFGERLQIPSTLEGVRISLKETISGKKYLIVLDDLWEEDGGKLEELRGMLQGGSKDSKIIITTRSENVAALSGAAKSCKLDVLSYDHCWNLFYRRAFTSESEKNDKDLSRIGREIVKKCGGVPLAAKSLGYTMRLKKGADAWLEVRDTDIWWFEEKNGSSFKTAMLPSLKLSYYFMPSYLKLCFVYCSIFPKGSEIRKNDLIQQWIALGFIQPTHEGLSLVKRGEQYVKDLLGMSFLQLTGPSGRFPNGLHMHDLVHDLARYIVGNELLILNAKQGISSHFVGNDYYYALLLNFEDITRVYPNLRKKIRAIFFCSHFQKSPDDCRKKMQFPVNTVSHAKCLRMLHFGHCYLTEFPDSLRKMKQLRYLSARGAKLQVLPESFGDLINLRYLCISYNCFKKLPVSFGNLTNLQILILDGCQELEFLPEPLNLVNMNELSLQGCNNLRKLPDTIGNSTMLRILDISYCRALSITPSFVGILGRLIKLDMVGSQYPLALSILRDFASNFFLVKEGTSHLYDIIEINEMIALKTTSHFLEIASLENVNNPGDVSKIGLCAKSELQAIKLKWTYPQSRSVDDMARDEEILKNLMPNRGLTELILDGYSGLNFPFWIMNIGYFLPNLTRLDLQNTETCEHLPPLGLLPNLSGLKVHNMPNLRRIDEAFFGGQGAFRRLEVLILDSLLELEEWPTKLPSNVEKFVFTHLHNLEVRNCPKLRFVPSFPGSENWWIEKSPHVLSSRATHESTHLTVILALEIKSCEFESGILPYIIRQMTNLHTLCMESCENLTIIPKWLGELTSLEQLQIRHCKSLNSLPLSVLDLPFIKSIQIVEGNQTLAEWCSQHDRFKIAANPNKSYSTITFHKEH